MGEDCIGIVEKKMKKNIGTIEIKYFEDHRSILMTKGGYIVVLGKRQSTENQELNIEVHSLKNRREEINIKLRESKKKN